MANIATTATTSAPGEVRTALLSVHDKSGLGELAQALVDRDVLLLASGGTAAHLEGAGLPVTRIEEFTGAPELLGGRVKTLHPRIHAGLLADRRDPAHMAELEDRGYRPIDLVVCNLYPFEADRNRLQDPEQLTERIDIGGVSLLRAGAKNADGGVSVLSDPADYPLLVAALGEEGAVPRELRGRLAARAFRLAANHEEAVASWWEGRYPEPGGLPPRYRGLALCRELRYGENPHQRGALYREPGPPRGVAHGEQLQGRELSYNNLLDMDGAYRAASLFSGPSAAVVKHGNPCGLSEARDQESAFERALSGDPLSAYGSVLGFNQELTEGTARAILSSRLFVECIVAPGFAPGAREVLARRKRLRLVRVPGEGPDPAWTTHGIGGGFLLQEVDPGPGPGDDWEIVTGDAPEGDWRRELGFAMRAVQTLRSNAIAVVRDRTLVGAGMGLPSRVDACRLALGKAGDRARGACLASDAFLPFDDCVELAAEAGIGILVQPGGSRRDPEVQAACERHGLTMVFTGRRHFRH